MSQSKLLFATNSPHKLMEVRQILNSSIPLLSLSDLGHSSEIPETAETLEGNARQKAKHIHNLYQMNCFADDTGLEVESLNGRPGVHTAHFAGSQRSSTDNITKLLNELNGIQNRNARFRTVISLLMDGEEYLFEGVVDGDIVKHPAGSMGFGYDPIFVPKGYTQTFAQMPIILKNTISHRAIAISKLNDFFEAI